MLRRQWIHYYTGVQGLAFVIDCTDHARIDMAKQELLNAMADDQLSGVPLAILANKQDSSLALSTEQLKSALNLNSENSAFSDREVHVFETCAIKGDGVIESFEWLCSKMKPL